MEKIKQQTIQTIQRKFDEQGLVIISKSFVKTKYILSPLPKEPPKEMEAIDGHPIWKGEWIRDNKEGAIIYINKKKL